MAEEKKVGSSPLRLLIFSVKLPVLLIAVLIIASSALTVGLVRKQPDTFGLLKGPSILQKEEIELVKRVGSHIDLPPDEQPTVATVTDKSQLTDQVFFRNSEQGDKVLIYTNSGKVVLYRPSKDMVVEVGTVNINKQEEGTEEGVAIEDIEVSYRFVVLNGTRNSGLAQDIGVQIENLLVEADIVQVLDAENIYNESIVVDVTGERGDDAKDLAEKLGMSLADLPSAEQLVEDVDFMIIVGKDKAPVDVVEEETSE